MLPQQEMMAVLVTTTGRNSYDVQSSSHTTITNKHSSFLQADQQHQSTERKTIK